MYNFFKNFIYTSSTQILVFIATFLFSVFTARLLGPLEQGRYALIFMSGVLIARFSSLGFENANAYYAKSEKYGLNQLASNSIILSILSVIVNMIVLYFVAYRLNLSIYLTVLLLILTKSLLLKSLFQSILVGKNDLKSHSFALLTDAIFQLISIIIVHFTFELTVSNVLLINLISSIVNFLLCFRLCKFNTFKLSKELFKDSFKYGYKGWLNNLSNTLIYRVDIYIIAFYMTSADVSYYAIAVLITEKIWFFNNAIFSALFPSLRNMNLDDGIALTALINRCNLILSLIAILGLLLIAKPFILIVFGLEYETSYIPLVALLPGILFLSIPKILISHFASMNKMQYTYLASFPALIVNVILNFLLIPPYGILGAAISTSFSYFFYSIISIYFYTKITRISISDLLIIKFRDIRYILLKFKVRK